MAFSLQVHPAVSQWVEEDELASFAAAHPQLRGVTVRLWPRWMQDVVTGDLDRLPPYAFRAVSRGEFADVLVDETETPHSVTWLVVHELAHHLVDRDPNARDLFDSVRVSDLAPHGDDFHRVDPEERWADALATKWTGERLDRDWWRGRVLEAT